MENEFPTQITCSCKKERLSLVKVNIWRCSRFFAIKTVFEFDKIPLTIAKYISLKEKNNHDKKGILLFMLLATNILFSQEKKFNEYKKLVDSAISIAANNYMLQLSENSSKENNIIYVVDENSKPIDLDSIKSKLPLKTIDINNKNNRKTLKKGLKILKVRPLLQGNKITITIINFLVKYKGKEYHYFNNGGSFVFFEYSCQEEKWILTKVEHIGI